MGNIRAGTLIKFIKRLINSVSPGILHVFKTENCQISSIPVTTAFCLIVCPLCFLPEFTFLSKNHFCMCRREH